MGFFKDLFIVNEDKDKEPQTKEVQPQLKTTIPQQPQYNPSPVATAPAQQPINVPPVTIPGGNVDKNILEMIKEVIDKSNVPGNDYYELNKIVESQDFKNAIPDERARIIAAYHSLRAQDSKFDKQKISDSIDFYIKEVKSEYDNVLQGYNQYVNEKINGPKKKIEDLQASRQELLTKINQLDVEIQTIEAEVSKCTAELEAKRANYDATFNIVIQELENEKIKLNNILP